MREYNSKCDFLEYKPEDYKIEFTPFAFDLWPEVRLEPIKEEDFKIEPFNYEINVAELIADVMGNI